MAQTTRPKTTGGDLPLDAGADANDTAAELGTKTADAVTATGADLDAGNNLDVATLKKLPQLAELSGTGTVLDEDGAAVASTDGLEVIGTAVVSFPDPAKTVNVVCSVLNFPVTTDSGVTRTPTSKVAFDGTVYGYMFDDITGPIHEGKVPAENSTGQKRAQTPWIPTHRAWAVDDAVYEISTGIYWIVKTGAGKDELKSVEWVPTVPTVKENLDDWDKTWGPQGSSWDYQAVADKGRAADGAFGAVVADKPDPLLLSAWAAADIVGAAKRLIPPGTVFMPVAGSVVGTVVTEADLTSTTSATKTAAEKAYTDKFKLLYGLKDGKPVSVPGDAATVHPSVVGALYSALYESADLRTDQDEVDIKPTEPADILAIKDDIPVFALPLYPEPPAPPVTP
jgi:hypothetical protein